MNSGIADPELRKAFNELQMKLLDTKNKLETADHQIKELQQNSMKKELAQKQLEIFPTETRMFFGCGKMFILDDKTDIVSKMNKDVEANTQKIKSLEVQKDLLNRNQKDAEENLREMITAKKQLASA